MRDSRIAIIGGAAGAPVTINSNTTTYGDTINLLDGYVGDYKEGAMAGYGIGIELMFKVVSATALDVEVFWQTSTDGSTWVRDELIIPATELVAAIGSGTKLIVSGRLRTKRQYARIAIVTTNISGESFTVQGWASDGTGDLNGTPTRI